MAPSIDRRTFPPRIASPAAPGELCKAPAYTIATLVSDRSQYDAMLASFRANGFTDADCEFLYADNTGPEQCGAYAGLNALLNAARAPYVILCHQDVRLVDDDRAVLDARLSDLETRDSDWALAGNAGGIGPGKLALRISDPHGRNVSVGDLPARVSALDENFIVVRRNARIGFSRDLEGYHFYGADICLHAAVMGFNAYVIDFHLEHLSAGKKGTDFGAMEEAFRAKWSRALAPRWLQTTCALLRLSGAPGNALIARVASKPFAKISKRLPGASGWSRPSKRSA